MIAMLVVTSAVMSAVVLADTARVEQLRIKVYPRPLLPHAYRYGSIDIKLYRKAYGHPTVLALHIWIGRWA